jgi:hypothetical protein
MRAKCIAIMLALFAAVASASDYVETLKVRDIRFVQNFELTQLVDGWAVYANARDYGEVRMTPYLIAVRADGIPKPRSYLGQMREGARLIFQLGLETRLGRLPDTTVTTTRGFEVTIRRYVVIHEGEPHGTVAPR